MATTTDWLEVDPPFIHRVKNARANASVHARIHQICSKNRKYTRIWCTRRAVTLTQSKFGHRHRCCRRYRRLRCCRRLRCHHSSSPDGSGPCFPSTSCVLPHSPNTHAHNGNASAENCHIKRDDVTLRWLVDSRPTSVDCCFSLLRQLPHEHTVPCICQRSQPTANSSQPATIANRKCPTCTVATLACLCDTRLPYKNTQTREI